MAGIQPLKFLSAPFEEKKSKGFILDWYDRFPHATCNRVIPVWDLTFLKLIFWNRSQKRCFGQKFIAKSFHLMNILAEEKSFSLWIDDSICSLNKTQIGILILITSIKKVCKLTWTQDSFPWWTFFPALFRLKLFKFASKFVRLSILA